MFKFALLVPMFAATVAFAQTSDHKAEFQKMEDAFAAAFNKGDAASVAKNYADDAVFLPQEQDTVAGRKNIEGLFGGFIKALTNMKLTTLEVQMLSGDLAYEIGSVTMDTRDNPPHKLTGKYATLWKKNGGHWIIVNDMINYTVK